MRYATKRRYRKYVKEYGCLSFASKLGDRYVKKLMDTVRKRRIDAKKMLLKE